MLPKTLKGTVTKFKGDGRRLGYPTANIRVETDLKDGVYFGHADLVDYKNNPAIIFIGTPTTMGETERRVEAHLLDVPDQDYYDHGIKLTLKYFQRSNKTFQSMEELIKAMANDLAVGRKYFANNSKS